MYDQFRASMRPAIEEARNAGMPDLARLLEDARDYMFAQSADAMRARMKEWGIAVFSEAQAEALIRVAGAEMARQVIEQTRAEQYGPGSVWDRRSLRYTVIGGIIGLVLSTVATSVGVAALVFHVHP
jgi:hypothetical protein